MVLRRSDFILARECFRPFEIVHDLRLHADGVGNRVGFFLIDLRFNPPKKQSSNVQEPNPHTPFYEDDNEILTVSTFFSVDPDFGRTMKAVGPFKKRCIGLTRINVMTE